MQSEAIPYIDREERTKSYLTWSTDLPQSPTNIESRELSDEALIEGGARLEATPEQVEVARKEMEGDIFEQLKGAREKIATLTGENAELKAQVERLTEALQIIRDQVVDIINSN
jgi:DNA repair exonuclease SbcCD ATPase subunit